MSVVAKPTASEFRSFFEGSFPDSNFSDAVVEKAIDLAFAFNAHTQTGVRYAAAHILTVEMQSSVQDGGSGEVTLSMLGAKQVQMMPQAESGRESYFTSTHYGRTFLTLEKRNVRRPFAVMLA